MYMHELFTRVDDRLNGGLHMCGCIGIYLARGRASLSLNGLDTERRGLSAIALGLILNLQNNTSRILHATPRSESALDEQPRGLRLRLGNGAS